MGFVIVGSYRSGSTFLQTLLDHHPRLRCAGEVFHPNPLVRKQAALYLGLPLFQGQSQYLGAITAQEGIKVTYPQLAQLPNWRDQLSGHRILHLIRNPIRCVLSAREALARGVFHWRTPNPPPSVPPQLLPLPWLKQEVARLNQWRAEVRAWGRTEQYREVDYGLLVSEGIQREVWSFLSVDPRAVEPATYPIANGSVPDRIRNIEWIVQALGEDCTREW